MYMGKISKSTINYEDNRSTNTKDSHVHDNIDVSGVGHTVNVNKSKPIILPLDESYLDRLIRLFGRWLLSVKKGVSLPVLIIPSCGSIYVIMDWVWWDFIDKFSVTVQGWTRVLSIFWLIVIFGLFIMIRRDICPSCKKLLAVRIVKREKLNTDKYQGKKIHNVKETSKCDFCHYTFSDTVVEEE